MSKRGKTFAADIDSALSPAAAIILGGARAEEAPRADTGTDGARAADTARESKTRRVQSLLKPSLYAFLGRSAARHGVSINDRLNTLLQAAKEQEEE